MFSDGHRWPLWKGCSTPKGLNPPCWESLVYGGFLFVCYCCFVILCCVSTEWELRCAKATQYRESFNHGDHTLASLFNMPWEVKASEPGSTGKNHTDIGLKWMSSSHVKKYFPNHLKMQKSSLQQALHSAGVSCWPLYWQVSVEKTVKTAPTVPKLNPSRCAI